MHLLHTNEAGVGINCGSGMFDQHRGFLEERMDPDSGLLDKLLGNKTLSKIEYDKIKSHQYDFYERNARLLDYISQKNKYDSLIGALRDTRQTHLVNYLIGNGEHKSEYDGDWPLTGKETSILDANRESLVDLMDCGDLLVRLYSAEVINGRQRQMISSELTNYRSNEVLLDILRRRSIDDYRQMVRCLYESNQSHVAEILDKGGVVVRVHADLGNDKDADRTEDDIITRFTDIISGKSLDEANRMLNKITNIGLTVIAAKKGQSVVLYVYCKTTKELLDLYDMNVSGKLKSTVEQLFKQLLFASSTVEYADVTVENFKDVVECALTQQFYRSQMERLTVALPTEEYKKCRSYFSDECRLIRAVFDFKPGDIGRRKYNKLRKALLPVTQDDDFYSMVLSFKKGDYMMTSFPENIGDTSVLWKVEHLSNGRIGYILRRHVVIDYSQGLRATGRNLGLLERPTTLRTTTVSPTNTINVLPLELLDIILQKSLIQPAFIRDRFKDQSDRFLVTRLATVDHCWLERLRKRKFKRIILRHLSIAFKKIYRVSFILRSNQSFLMERIRFREGLIDQLRLCDCLTDVQSRILKRQTVTSGKRKLINRNNSSDMLHVMRSYDDTRRSDCFRCFRQSGQKLVTKVIDNAGVAIKVNLCGRDAGNLQQLSERLNDLQDKFKQRSDTKERVISHLIDSGIEIFQSHMDRQAVLYIWCKSQMGLKNLCTLYESKFIVDVIGDLTKKTSSAIEPIGSRMVDVDIDQFKKSVVVCPIVDRFTASLDINEDEEVTGVTMLRQEICVLVRNHYSSRHAIRVYQNRNPFRLNARIDLSFVQNPEDIGSSDVENCFFVHDLRHKSVWKIARHGGNYHNFLHIAHLSERPPMLSVSSDGQELLILTLTSLEIYRVFGLEWAVQKPLLIVQLPSDIGDPRHAVETSSGHFIILHSLVKYVGEEQMKQMLAVSKVTRDGRLVVRRVVPKNKEHEPSRSCYLALDSNARVFVADENNDRVFVLDSDLSWIQNLCSTEDVDKSIRRPFRLCYDKVERQLIVAETLNREGVNIYSIGIK